MLLFQDLATCMYGLHEHMRFSSGDDDKLQDHSDMTDFRDHHATDVNACLANLTLVFPDIVRSHIGAAASAAVSACNNRSMNTANRVVLLRRLSLIVEHGM